MSSIDTVAAVVAASSAAAIALVGGLSWLYRRFHRFATRFDEFMEDWHGTEARPGVPHRPGVMERLSQQDQALGSIDGRLVAVEAELNPNGGKSVKDAVGRVDGHLNHIRNIVDDLGPRVADLERRERTRGASR